MASVPLQRREPGSAPPAAKPGRPVPFVRAARWPNLLDDDFRAQWRALAANASEPNPFAEEWFVSASLAACDPNGSVRLFAFYDGGRLRGVMPLEFATSYYGYPLPHLSGWRHDNSFCGLPLVETGFEQTFWDAVLDWAITNTTIQCFLHIEQLPADGPIFTALRKVARSRGDPAAIVHRQQRAMLHSSDTAENYFAAALSGKKRKELRRQYNRLSDLGTVAISRQTDTANLSGWTSQFLVMEKAGWKGLEGSSLACDPTTETLFCRALEGAAGAGRLERLTLSLDDRPIAMLVNFRTPPGAFSFKTTFDETYARFSPGVLLQRENLAVLDDPAIDWTDSCAAADHPMIERIWREKRELVSVSIGIGGSLRKAAFRQLIRAESGTEMLGDQS